MHQRNRRLDADGSVWARLTGADWFPKVDGGSLYLRLFMFASGPFLGVRPARQYKFVGIASPAGNYTKSYAPAVSIWVLADYTRAAPRPAAPAAKCGGNYAASLVPQAEAIARGHDQVVLLDAGGIPLDRGTGRHEPVLRVQRWRTDHPPPGGTILPGITRDSLLLAQEEGLTVREERCALDQWRADTASGRLIETFACGTAAVVTPVGRVASTDGEFTIDGDGPGQNTQRLRERLFDVQRGTAPDSHGWVKRLI